nr:DUF2515 family protein [Caldalkalibacillus salinus]
MSEWQKHDERFLQGKPSIKLTDDEQRVVSEIEDLTEKYNRNNVTRTKAYLSFYRRHPEIHWALLAHMVSRNGGWNMTDLKGDMLPHLLSKDELKHFFHLLERCNWLIFQDAYPQLLLYERSKQSKKPLFHLLPYFHVSTFMKLMWSWFWLRYNQLGVTQRSSKGITYALIMNEQHHIEDRVVQHPSYEHQVFEHWPFIIQQIMHFNQVLFPYLQGRHIRVAGTIMRKFQDIQERIRVGKRLYQILFITPEVSPGIQRWALKTEHTGSRQDYWPRLFSDQRSFLSASHTHLKGNQLHKKNDAIYSPTLQQAWPNVTHRPAERAEWCTKEAFFQQWAQEEKNKAFEMTNEHLDALNKIDATSVGFVKLFRK